MIYIQTSVFSDHTIHSVPAQSQHAVWEDALTLPMILIIAEPALLFPVWGSSLHAVLGNVAIYLQTTSTVEPA